MERIIQLPKEYTLRFDHVISLLAVLKTILHLRRSGTSLVAHRAHLVRAID